MSKEVVLCVSNAYQKKYYLNENFNGLPQTIRDELKIMCVLYTEDVGGILELVFDEDGNLDFRTSCKENDFFYDEIGSVLKSSVIPPRVLLPKILCDKAVPQRAKRTARVDRDVLSHSIFGRRTRGGITNDLSTGRRKYKHNMRRV